MYETQKKRRIRRPAAWLLAVLLTGALCCQTVWADQRTLIPVGKAVGIKLFADGVLVVSTSSDGPCPARDCGIQEGDLIVSCNGERITSAEELQALLQAAGGTPAAVGLRRDGKSLTVTAVPVQAEDGSWRLGAWTRDSMAGVGTLTFYDPDTGAYGALGHGITDTDTAQLMPLSSGSIILSGFLRRCVGPAPDRADLRRGRNEKENTDTVILAYSVPLYSDSRLCSADGWLRKRI